MPVTALVTTAGATTSNAYVTIAVANQYHLDKVSVGTTWADAATSAKQAAILEATRLLDSQIVWLGWIVTNTQALLWPRSGLTYRNGSTVSSTAIPTDLQHACSEFARQLLADDRTGDSPSETLGLESIDVGTISLKFDGARTPRVIPRAVLSLIPSDWVKSLVGGYVEAVRA